jgi:hypothetical protein
VVEGGLLADNGLHAAHAGRELRVFDIQFDIGGELSTMAVRAQIIWTRDGDFAHDAQHWFGAQFLIAGLMAARARDAPLLGRNGELQQLAERCGAGVVQGRSHSHLGRFQIEAACLAALLKDNAQELVYFPRDFLADRFRRFFSWVLGASSSTGRNSQIRSLTSNNWPLSSRKRWYSATSRCALAKLAGEKNVSVTVLPSTFRVKR